MKLVVGVNGEMGTLFLDGQFDFSAYQEFRQASQQLLDEPDVHEIVVDLTAVPYLDGSALGMLLFLKERATEKRKTMVLTHCQDTVRQVLEIACFNKLFIIRQ